MMVKRGPLRDDEVAMAMAKALAVLKKARRHALFAKQGVGPDDGGKNRAFGRVIYQDILPRDESKSRARRGGGYYFLSTGSHECVGKGKAGICLQIEIWVKHSRRARVVLLGHGSLEVYGEISECDTTKFMRSSSKQAQ
ncbi:uncharacterized protein LOC112351136 [Selaginella moellendorffii]|uniref:uncharacterized protein LOC112351136 n=1 Tax=Selaginella moellendorffii TaxID=88036 RepID=UPI000D1D0A4F|nr:uncharacterized protein LOC112351136 [Selaginella moellendorffii]|eukprot:XP_024544230.1 uncharacterized protein LOC112351136 [Selaginella moellendorffii]